MPIEKIKRESGFTWGYRFDAPGSTRTNRKQIRESGFATKKLAGQAEIAARIEAQRKYELSLAGPAPIPTTLADMLREHLSSAQLQPKTLERDNQLAGYLSVELCSLPLVDVKPHHLAGEWKRLLASGGHHRKTKAPRPLSPKTVRNIAGVVSAAFGKALRFGFVQFNPVPNSDLPRMVRKEKPALTVAQQDLLIASAPSQLVTFLMLDAASACRRGELLALRWQDYSDGAIYVSRSLSQTKAGLTFKSTKTERPRRIALPASAVRALELHCAEQAELRKQFGPDYQTELDLVFCQPDGSPLKPDSISSTVSALCKRLKLPKGVSLHALRHTHVSVLFASGVPLTEISKRLGHSNPHVTATIYAHMLPGRDNLAAEAWEKFQNENREPKQAAEDVVQ